MRVNTLITGTALAVAATSALLAGLALPAAAEPTKPFGGMTQTDLKLFCQKNGGEYKGIEYGEGWYTCKLPNGYLIYCKAGTCQISRLEPESTTPPRGTVVWPTAAAGATR